MPVLYDDPYLLAQQSERLIIPVLAAPSDMFVALSSCVSHELYLSSVKPVYFISDNCHDYQPIVEKDRKPRSKSARFPPCARLGEPPTTNHFDYIRTKRWEPPTRCNSFKPS